MSWFGPYLAACLLLVVAGAGKALRPADTARALAATWSLATRGPTPAAATAAAPPRLLVATVRSGALAEAVLGITAAVLPRPPLVAAVAGSYLAFAVVVAAVRWRGGPLASCGCLGTPDTPATWLHVVVDLALAGAALSVAAAGGAPDLGSVLAAQPLDGIPLLAGSAVLAWLAALAFSRLATLAAVRRLLASTPRSGG